MKFWLDYLRHSMKGGMAILTSLPIQRLLLGDSIVPVHSEPSTLGWQLTLDAALPTCRDSHISRRHTVGAPIGGNSRSYCLAT